MTKGNRVAIYIRVSTEEQTTENQLHVLQEWAANRGFTVVKVYEESESAWKDGHQKELARLLQDARRRQFDVVIVWALDRLSRQGSRAILEIWHKLKNFGVVLLSHQEAWTEAPGELGELLFAIAGWVARMESQRRSDRTKAGMTRVAREGKHVGRPLGKKDQRERKRKA